ncbi:alpha/beta hydrolase [Pusillimonas sp. CC-YST705]|uniref:Alpha/beta hydrolase n=1 Tax=Mesopusillimonas faecipullorum TaxID=2755040 RepID=A0ABS8CDY6_9BURK|nr:alpha/beta hydrolase [Mesopusillimonas faecipullorum]MCB5364242.1 alpha/beta hydrolase [Mesopusillimonas faecipullorum]
MSKETLLLLPGLLCDEAVWPDQVSGLAHRAQSVIPDYGMLDSISAMASHVLQTAPTEVFNLAGHSMGGRVALEVVRQAPQRVRRLALLDTGYEPFAGGEAGEQEKSKRYALLERARNSGMREMGKLWAPGMVHPSQLQTPLFEAILDMIERRTPAQFEAQIKALLARPDAEPVLRGINCPTWLICGHDDAWSPYARHEVMSQMVPAQWSRIEGIKDCGHMSTMEKPTEVTALLNAWLDTPVR